MGLVSFGEKYELRKGRSSSKLVASLGKDATVRFVRMEGDVVKDVLRSCIQKIGNADGSYDVSLVRFSWKSKH